jgi:fibronectin-binding autotransporter adhesin
MKCIWTAIVTAAVTLLTTTTGWAETWNVATGSSWNTAANWNPATIPSAIGAAAIFNGAATANNPDQTANRTITLDGTKTVGSIVLNNDLSTFTNSITTGSGGPLVLDAVDGGPATINVPAAIGTGNNTISVATRLDDTLVATVDNITATSAAGALNLTAAITGAGGFTKLGPGLATFGTGTKTYTGPTNINDGRLRMSLTARAQSTSSFTIGNGGQVVFIAGNVTQSFTLGPGPLNLNGAGPISGPYAAFPGALRPDRDAAGRDYTITNDVVLQSDSLIHVQSLAATNHSLTLPGIISGPGQLQFTAANTGDPELGKLILTGTAANTYSGGTLIRGGTIEAKGALTSLGTGNVTVLSGSLLPDAGAAAIAKLLIQAGDGNAIANTATLSLAGGKTADVADDGFLELLTDETVGGLILGGVAKAAGTYGSTSSTATNKFDEYFSGTGILTVAPALHPGDFDGDGDVDGADFVAWQTNFPFTPGPGASPVPEPSSVILLSVCGVIALARRRYKVR